MAESFVLFDSDFVHTNNTDAANYIVLTNPAKAIDEKELFNYWLDSDNFTSEISDINSNWNYYYWKDDYDGYLPLTDNLTIEKLNEIIGFCSESTESKPNEVNDTNSTSKKYKLSIILENGTIIEPNFTSDNPADFAEMIEVMSSELYFAGNIKSIKIE